jgi:predicted permease
MDERLTPKRLLRIWWAWQWRSVAATFIGAMVLIFLFAFVAALFGMEKERITLVGNLIYLGVGVFASVYFLGYALKKDYGDFRIEVVEMGEDEEKERYTGETFGPMPQTREQQG